MRCSLPGALGAIVALVAALVGTLPAEAGDRTLPMRFDLRRQGPAESCGVTCKTYIAASGAITADSARDFTRAMQGRDLTDAILVLDSDGGSVLGAIALGREVRKLRLAATVGRVVDLKGDVVGKAAAKDNAKDNVERNADIPAVVSPRADCESMCAFVLLGGVQRTVPNEARVMVHQIWLGDRREDPTAATYSAEDLVLVQRDIGRLAQFTAEMGASMDLLDLALRIPPWEPLHTMTRAELRRTRLATDDAAAPPIAAVAVTPPVQASPAAPMTSGLRATPINEQRWAMVDRGGIASLARRHPFTVEGEPIGSFDLAVACGADADSFELSYVERRTMSDDARLSARPESVSLRTGGSRARLAVTASQRHDGPGELVSTATGAVSAALIREFASAGSRSMVIETSRKGLVTVIRIGNTGAQQSLPRLIASCAKPIGARADLAVRKTGGLASAQ